MKRIILASILATMASSAYADVIRSQCQTEESRGLRLASEAMYKAAKQSDPWANCMGGCQMASAVADMMTATKKRFEAEALASLLKGRAMEAAKCPQWERAIMENGPATAEEKAKVSETFKTAMAKEYADLAEMKLWQIDHPQCKHVEWQLGGWSDSGGNHGDSSSKEDFSGNFQGKKGQCSADGHGKSWRGTEDSLKMSDPATNDLIAKVVCANALQENGFSNGSYADPKLCEAE